MKKKRIKIKPIELFILASCALLYLGIRFACMDRVKVTGSIVDNDYNNCIAGANLIRIGDELYYNYNRGVVSHGLFKINKYGSKCIESVPFYYYSALNGWVYPIRKFNDLLIQGQFYWGTNYYYDVEGKDFNPFYLVEGNDDYSTLNFRELNGSILYAADNKDEDAMYSGINIMKYSEGTTQKLIPYDECRNIVYFCEDKVYYTAFDSDGHTQIRVASIDGSTNDLVYTVENPYISPCFMVEENYVVYVSHVDWEYFLYKIDLSKQVKEPEIVGELPDFDPTSNYFNCYDGKVYLVSDFGLIKFDLESNDQEILYDGVTKECYILDDTWIYFVKGNRSLWRITQDGQDLEKVYGW